MSTQHTPPADLLAVFTKFRALDDDRFQCVVQTLSDGRYVVITDTGGMGYPKVDDFMVCVYTSEDAFGDDPSTSILGCFDSEGFADIDHALGAADGCTEVIA